MVVIRENAGGLYFGECHTDSGPGNACKVTHTFSYRTEQVRRIIEIGIRLAKTRRRRLTLIVKQGGIPAISKLWTDNFSELAAGETLEASVLDVDNASYQIIAMARQFDVVVAPNLFGDIISDVAALLLGSRGLSYSGNFGAKDIAVYQTGHGAAHDLGGRGIANPIGQIQSAAMMLRESFGLDGVAAAIEKAVAGTLARGIRTADIASPESKIVGTRQMGQYIADALEGELSSLKIAS
jgi:3-isopropylmalate dehydrogenase